MVSADQITVEGFVESATRGVLRALQTAALNPQPLPPEPPELGVRPGPEARLNPQPLPPGILDDIIVGLVFKLPGGEVTEGTTVKPQG